MYFIFLAIITLGIAGWTCRNLINSHQEKVVYFLFPTVIIYIVYALIQSMKLTMGIEPHGTMRILCNMVSNCLLPMCYLTMCQLCRIRKFSATTICLFLFILFDLFTKATVYTDYVPVAHVIDDVNIHFYRNGKVWMHINTYEFVEMLQLTWIVERLIKFGVKSRHDKLKITHKAKTVLTLASWVIIIMIISHLLPDKAWGNKAFNYITIFVNIASNMALLFCLGYGDKTSFITDSNNEMIYFSETPNTGKMHRQLDKLIELQKIHRNEGLTINSVAKMLDTNSYTITDLMKNEYGTTFTAFIAKARIDDAKEMIRRNPGTNFNEIATKCGFNSAVNFSKAFKKVTGLTAREWVEQQKSRRRM